MNCDQVHVLILILHPRVVHLLFSPLLVVVDLECLLLVLQGGYLCLQLDDLVLVVLVGLLDVGGLVLGSMCIVPLVALSAYLLLALVVSDLSLLLLLPELLVLKENFNVWIIQVLLLVDLRRDQGSMLGPIVRAIIPRVSSTLVHIIAVVVWLAHLGGTLLLHLVHGYVS